MENISGSHHLNWKELAPEASFILLGLSALILLVYLIRLAIISDSKVKYDFIARFEIKVLWVAALIALLAGAFIFNSSFESLSLLWVFGRLFTTLCMGAIIGLIIRNLLRFYYPFYIEGRLKKLRYKPRVSPKTGKEMRLLSEEEEDEYLDEGMQAEENLFSADYDVWIDAETGYIKIEKYSGHLHALECPECGYQTLKLDYEQKVKEPEGRQPGELVKHYKCSYCNYKVTESVPIYAPSKSDSVHSTSSSN